MVVDVVERPLEQVTKQLNKLYNVIKIVELDAAASVQRSFHYRHEGSLAQIGKRKAVIDFGWVKLRGAIAWWLWGIAHIYFLVGVRSRLSVALNWLWIYMRNQRGARLITEAARESAVD